MTRICVQFDGAKEASVEIAGKGPDLIRALTIIIYAMRGNCGLNVETFTKTLPMLLALEEASVDSATLIDIGGIGGRENRGGNS